MNDSNLDTGNFYIFPSKVIKGHFKTWMNLLNNRDQY